MEEKKPYLALVWGVTFGWMDEKIDGWIEAKRID
jgi:hypothetical protein